MFKKLKLAHLRNCIVLLVLCHSNVIHAIDINLKSPRASKQALVKGRNSFPFWSKQMNGAISDLSVSRNGKGILVATSPDQDIPETSDHYLLSRYNQNGKLIWQLKQSSPIKEVAVSRDASFIVVSNYENQLFALNASGKLLWSVDGMCKPILSNINKKIICYHDDDNEPKVGFDLYDWKGKKISSYPIHRDIVALKTSATEKSLVLGLAGGEVVFFSSDFKPLWKKTVPGEIVDVAVSSGETPVVAVLYRDKSSPKIEKIAILNSSQTLLPSAHSTQIELAPDGKTVFYYGNSSAGRSLGGQSLGGVSLKTSQEVWKMTENSAAEYNSAVAVTDAHVFAGFEENALGVRSTHILDLSPGGEVNKNWALSLEPSAYLYTYKLAPEASLLVVATDDGKITVYRY